MKNKKISLIIWIVTIIVLIISTLLPKPIYGEWWFVALLVVFSVNMLTNIIKDKMWKRPVNCAVHASILLVLLGGFLTFTTGQEGSMKLTVNEPTNIFIQDEKQVEIPFNVNLKKFDIIYYTGTMSHADYVTNVVLTDDNGNVLKEDFISMNNILKYKGFRFFNEDFEEDLSGCTLAVTHDPLGTTVTYFGYVLLFISMIIMFFQKIFTKSMPKSYNSGISMKNILGLLILMMIGTTVSAKELKTLPKDVAAQMGDIYIYYGGRISPLQTFAKDFTVKLYGKPTYKGYSSEQVLAGWMFYYSDWKEEKMIKIKKGSVNQLLGAEGKYISMENFRGPRNEYLLEDAAAQVKKRTYQGESKSIKAADEKYNLIVSLYSGKLMKIYPCLQADGSVKWLSQNDNLPETLNEDEWIFVRKSWSYVTELVVKRDYENLSATLLKIKAYQEKKGVEADGKTSLPSKTRFKAEKIYNVWAKYNFIAYIALCCGILLFVMYCGFTAAGEQMSKAIVNVSISISWVLFLFLTFLIILRWIVAGHIPLTKSVETQHFMAWVSLLFTGCAVFIRNRRDGRFADNNGIVNTIAAGLIVCGVMMLVSVMSSANPTITPLVPVLSSPLLGLHVAVIMVAYALLAFMLINGLAAVIVKLVSKHADVEIARMADVSRVLLYPAVMCLTFGIVIGSIWANISWGNYWAWDPKETWSLITAMIYATALYKDMTPSLQKPLNFHIFCILAFLSVLMTYFGVNYLGGMHAY